jgi:hypothetical protein
MIAEGRNPCGLPAWMKRGRYAMPLDSRMLFSVVRIIGDVPERVGSRRGIIGTGFAVTVESESVSDQRYGYIVTAHHVIDGQNDVEVQIFDFLNPPDLQGPFSIRDWRQPLDNVDLAVAPIPDVAANISAVQLEQHLLPAGKRPLLGGPIQYLGILADHGIPMARGGSIASLGIKGFPHPGGYEFDAHFADCRTYGGFSGSPCFYIYQFAHVTPENPPEWVPQAFKESPHPRASIDYLAMLCGMVTSHLTDHGVTEASKYGIVVLLESDYIREALMTDEMKKERREWDQENEAASRTGSSMTAENVSYPRDDDSQFDRFEQLARQVVNTPKPSKETE